MVRFEPTDQKTHGPVDDVICEGMRGYWSVWSLAKGQPVTYPNYARQQLEVQVLGWRK